MTNLYEIIPGIGLGDLKFGASFQQVRNALGEPDDIGKSEFEDEDSGDVVISEMWTWADSDLQAHFDEEDEFKLGMLSASSSKYTLMGLKLFGKKESEVIEMVQPLGFGSYEEEDIEFEDEHAPQGRIIAFVDKELEFWFEDGRLTEIQWSTFWADDETKVWPE